MRPVYPAYPAQGLRAGDIAFARMEKVNAELLSITYGSLVSELLRIKGDSSNIQADIERIGHNIGVRLVDEFLAKSSSQPCQSFRDVMESLSKVGMKMFLGVDADLVELGPKSFMITFAENPLNDFVELPRELKETGFSYSILYCGIIKGALDQLHMKVDCRFCKDVLRGDDTNAIQIDLVDIIRHDEGDD